MKAEAERELKAERDLADDRELEELIQSCLEGASSVQTVKGVPSISCIAA